MLSAAKKLSILRALWNMIYQRAMSPTADHQAQVIIGQAYEQLAQLWRMDVYGHRF